MLVSLEEAEPLLQKSNEARKALGFATVLPPDSVQRAHAQQAADKAAGN